MSKSRPNLPGRSTSEKPQHCQRFILFGLAAHALLLALAAALYPGGTYWDEHSPGFDVIRNFWCDLLRPLSHSGKDNRLAAYCARLSLVFLALTLPPFWRAVAGEFLERGPQRWSLLLLGNLGALGLLLVALATGAVPLVHELAILVLGPCGVFALGHAVLLSMKRPSWLTRSLGLATLALSLWNLLQYANQTLLGSPDWRYLPLVQRLATLSLLLWMTSFTLQSRRRTS